MIIFLNMKHLKEKQYILIWVNVFWLHDGKQK